MNRRQTFSIYALLGLNESIFGSWLYRADFTDFVMIPTLTLVELYDSCGAIKYTPKYMDQIDLKCIKNIHSVLDAWDALPNAEAMEYFASFIDINYLKGYLLR